jgi:hypothetical protein
VGFLPVFYAGSFLVLAFVGYFLCHVNSKAMLFRWITFWAILAFGASSYVGFIIVLLTIGNSPLAFLFAGTFGKATYVLAYALPGAVGAWLLIKAIKSFKPTI